MLYLKTNILPEVVLTSQSHTPSTSAATWIQWVCMCIYIYSELYNSWLVVSTPLKYESQWEGLSHMLWKIKAMFETTNQI